MSGLVALVGGLEHRPGLERLDERLLAHVHGRRPLVTVLPLASSARRRGPVADLAHRWWAERDAVVAVAPHGTAADLAAAVRLVRHADVVVLPGGLPDRLHRRLDGSPLWFEVVDAWRRGVSVSGASSGAMVLCARRQSVLPPFRLAAGLGLVPAAAAPHHDEALVGGLARWRRAAVHDVPVLGIDTSTGLVGRDGEFEVIGRGAVHVSWRGSVTVHHDGDHVVLGSPGAVATPAVDAGPGPGVHAGAHSGLGSGVGQAVDVRTA